MKSIYFKPERLYFGFIPLIMIVLVGVVSITMNQILIGIIISLIGVGFIINNLIKIYDKDPQVVFSNEGFYVKSYGQFKWSEIDIIKTKMVLNGKGTSDKMIVKFKTNINRADIIYNIDDLDVSRSEIEHLVKEYKK